MGKQTRKSSSKSSSSSLADLEEKIDELASKLNPIQEENARLVEENASLRYDNSQLVDRITKLISALETLGPLPKETPAITPSSSPAEPEDIISPDEPLNSNSNTLIISDSIYRHVLSSCPKQPGQAATITDNIVIGSHTIRKLVIPGACADRLWAEASSISASDRNLFSNVIVCVGANYTNKTSIDIAADEISDLLTALGDLFPAAQLAWTVMLPQPHKMDGIRYVNNIVTDLCHSSNIDLIWDPNFSIIENGDQHVRNHFARDGIHLNRKGIESMTKTVKEYLLSLYKY